MGLPQNCRVVGTRNNVTTYDCSRPRVVDFSDEGLDVDIWSTSARRKQVANEMGDVLGVARSNANTYAQRIHKACESFENFVEPKINSMDTEDLQADWISAAFSKAMDVLVDAIPIPGGGQLAKDLRSYLVSKVKTAMTDAAGKRPAGTDANSLKKKLKDLKETASAQDGPVGRHVHEKLKPLVSAIQRALHRSPQGNPSRSGLSQAQEEFLYLFYDTTESEKDSFLEDVYGIPTYKTSVVAGDRLFFSLIHHFSKLYAFATASRRDQITFSKGHPSRVASSAVAFRGEAQKWYYEKRGK